ncbi:MAG: peptidylprolyl isomerase [Cyanobacteriota bacterium]
MIQADWSGDFSALEPELQALVHRTLELAEASAAAAAAASAAAGPVVDPGAVIRAYGTVRQVLDRARKGRFAPADLALLQEKIEQAGGVIAPALRARGPASLEALRAGWFGRLEASLSPPVVEAAERLLAAQLQRRAPRSLEELLAAIDAALLPLLPAPRSGERPPFLQLMPVRQETVLRMLEAALRQRAAPACLDLHALVEAGLAEQELLAAAAVGGFQPGQLRVWEQRQAVVGATEGPFLGFDLLNDRFGSPVLEAWLAVVRSQLQLHPPATVATLRQQIERLLEPLMQPDAASAGATDASVCFQQFSMPDQIQVLQLLRQLLTRGQGREAERFGLAVAAVQGERELLTESRLPELPEAPLSMPPPPPMPEIQPDPEPEPEPEPEPATPPKPAPEPTPASLEPCFEASVSLQLQAPTRIRPSFPEQTFLEPPPPQAPPPQVPLPQVMPQELLDRISGLEGNQARNSRELADQGRRIAELAPLLALETSLTDQTSRLEGMLLQMQQELRDEQQRQLQPWQVQPNATEIPTPVLEPAASAGVALVPHAAAGLDQARQAPLAELLRGQLQELMDPQHPLSGFLQRLGLLRQVGRNLLLQRLADSVLLEPEQEDRLLEELWQGRTEPRPLQATGAWLAELPPGDQQELQLRWQELRLHLWLESHYAQALGACFDQRRAELERVVLSLIRLDSSEVAEELYLRLLDDGADFGQLARDHSLGEERHTRGLIGPLPIGQLHGALQRLIATLPAGELHPPVVVDDWVVLVKLEERLPVELEGRLRDQLLQELFEADLEATLAAVLPEEAALPEAVLPRLGMTPKTSP